MLFVLQFWTALGLFAAECKAFSVPVIHSPSHDPSTRSNIVTYTPVPIPSLSEQTIWDSKSEVTLESTETESTTVCTTALTVSSFTSSVRWTESKVSTSTVISAPSKSISTISTISVFPTTSELTTLTTKIISIPSTTTSYVPTTITPPPSPPPNPCPTTCSISAGTVNLFYWPSDGHVYPSTYSNTHLNWTFTSPSVYMVIDNIYGYNTAGRAGPSGTSVVFPLDLDQVSTIIPEGSITQQLTLSDLGTDCPQTEAESVIATAAPNGRCDPILAAPKPVKSWASPCNACGNFGLFDPPYAVAPLTGRLVPETTTTSMTKPEVTITSTTSATDITNTAASEVSSATSNVASYSSETSPPSETTSSSAATMTEIQSPSPTEDMISSGTISTAMPTAPSTSEIISSSSSSLSPSMSTPAVAAGTKKSIGRFAWLVLGTSTFALLS
ncbi:unnamed protein product [Penicillium salamii]|uniref:Uncharacterized protein n=1 Tax=Penicillium salamii TaxID=1612424 RepID=A0A9W4NVQ9_9EURO|nr:unnamed protein product [Penicillium salamii]